MMFIEKRFLCCPRSKKQIQHASGKAGPFLPFRYGFLLFL